MEIHLFNAADPRTGRGIGRVWYTTAAADLPADYEPTRDAPNLPPDLPVVVYDTTDIERGAVEIFRGRLGDVPAGL